MDNNIVDTLKNNNAITFRTKPGIQVGSSVLNPGMTNEQKVFKFKGRVKKNKPTVIATMRVDAASNKKFTKAPSLQRYLSSRKTKNKSSLKIKLSSIVKDDNKNIVAYLYNLVYTGKEKISKTNSLKYSLETKMQTILTKILGIMKVKFGRDEVLIGGESRVITVYGDPDSSFKLALTKIVEEKNVSGEVTSVGEESLLKNTTGYLVDDAGTGSSGGVEKRSIANSTIQNHLGEVNVISKTLDKTGKYSFLHKFPPSDAETKYGVNILPTTISSQFNTKIFEKDRDGWEGWYSKVLVQSPDPSITIRHFMVDNTAPDGTPHREITIGDGKTNFLLQAGNGNSFNFDRVYIGQYNKTPNQIKTRGVATATGGYLLHTFEEKYTLTIAGGTHEFGIVKSTGPILNNINQSDSNWTNSVPADNGGTNISIETISPPAITTTTNTNDTCRFTIKYMITNWGTKDTVYALDLNQIITVTT